MRESKFFGPVVIGIVVVIFAALFFVSKMGTSSSPSPIESDIIVNGPEIEITVENTADPDSGTEASVPRDEYDTIKDSKGWAAVSDSFSKVVVNPDGGKDWSKKVSPFMTDKMADTLVTIDPRTIPSGVLVGKPELIEYGQNYVIVESRYNTSDGLIKVRYRIVKVVDKWKVDLYQPVT